jgi:hypothetical protein
MKAFQQTQLEFVAHIKDPESNPFKGEIEDARLKIYRDLFFNNVSGFLSSGFPVLESLYAPEDWQALARRFFADHHCRSPYFVDISKEFVEFLSNEYQLTDKDPEFMQELAHYEWLELDLSVRKAGQQFAPWDQTSKIENVVVSELASLVSYQYPVHQISPDFRPQEPSGPIYLVVYRDNEDAVNFTLVNEVTAHLINIVQQNQEVSLQDLIQVMIEAMPQLAPQQVADSVQQVVVQLLTQQILLPVTI